MTLTYRLYGPTPEEAARCLATRGAQMRQDRARAKIRETTRALREQLGMEPAEALLP